MADVACLALAGFVLALSLFGFVAAVHDKRQARRGRRRVPERTFWAGALLGAWPGLALAFVLARHKTRKGRFLAPFLLASAANGVALWFAARGLGCWP